jgi:hypothetical protein
MKDLPEITVHTFMSKVSTFEYYLSKFQEFNTMVATEETYNMLRHEKLMFEEYLCREGISSLIQSDISNTYVEQIRDDVHVIKRQIRQLEYKFNIIRNHRQGLLREEKDIKLSMDIYEKWRNINDKHGKTIIR